jgi:VanZ family protein
MVPLPRWLIVVGFWIPFVVTTYAAFAPEGVPMPFQVSDIVLHAAAFTYLTAALWFAHHGGDRGWKPAAWMMAYGTAIELIQSFEPTRSAEIKDLVVDAVGILAGLGVYRWVVVRLFSQARARTEGRVTSP